jgi:hypothetical protein
MKNSLMGLPPRAWILPLVLPVTAGWIAWATGPDLPAAKVTRSSEDQWVLARSPVPDLKKASEYHSTASIWGKVDVVKKDEPVVDPAWRFLAVMVSGSEKYVVIAVDKQPNRQLKVGDQLPGGAKIHEIRQGSVCVIVNGKKRLLPIYPQDRQIL